MHHEANAAKTVRSPRFGPSFRRAYPLLKPDTRTIYIVRLALGQTHCLYIQSHEITTANSELLLEVLATPIPALANSTSQAASNLTILDRLGPHIQRPNVMVLSPPLSPHDH